MTLRSDGLAQCGRCRHARDAHRPAKQHSIPVIWCYGCAGAVRSDTGLDSDYDHCAHEFEEPRSDGPVSEYETKGWSRERCLQCDGHGVVAVYSAYDFEGPGECVTCGGSGIVWRTPKGRYVAYPGGRFV